MKNTITFLLISLLQCLVYGQDHDTNKDLFGTWQTDDKVHEIKIDKLLNGTYENKLNNRTLKFIANGLSNFENGINVDIPDAIAVSISLMNDHEGDKVNSTMTGQMYIDTVDNYTKILQLFHVLKTDNNDLNSGETLFFKKTENDPPLVTHNEIANSNSSLEGLIGPWKNSNASNGLNIIHIIGNNISATYNYFDPNMKQNFLIKLKGYVQSTTNGNYYFSLSGISIPFPPTVWTDIHDKTKHYYQLNSYSMSLVGEIIDNGSNYSIKSSLNLAHAYGSNDNYSAVRSQGAYFTKSKTSSFDYEVIQNGMEKLKFTNNGATNWVSNMKVGSNQTLKMALDTGGNYDWVNSTQCTMDACTNYDHTQFNHFKSNSFTWINEDSKPKNWGPWGGSEANLGFDLVKIDPNNVVPREISLIKEFIPPPKGNMDQFKELLWDGALAIPSFSSGGKYKDENFRISNVIIDLVTSGTIDPDKLKVSFYYDKVTGKGTYVIGSGVIDATKVDIESKITLAQKNYVDPDANDHYAVSYLWSTALNSVKVGGETIAIDASNTVFAFDTGSSGLKGEPKKMDQVITMVKNSSHSANIEYSMGVNKEGETGRFVITPEQYYQEIEKGDEKGTKQIQVKDDLGGTDNLWCQGTTLLEDLYSVFTYDISFNTRGELVLKARNVELYNKVGGPQIIQSGNTCEEKFTDSGGIDGNYQDSTRDTIVFKPGSNWEKVTLDFEKIKTEEHYDFLNIYNGLNVEEANLIEKYSGSYENKRITSTDSSGALTVIFTSDGSITKEGWKAKVVKECSTKTQNHCKEEFTDSGGNSGNYEIFENNFYNPYVFTPETGKKVALDFKYIDINPYDYLLVFDGPTIDWTNYNGFFTGSHENIKITSTHSSGALSVVFISNFWRPKRGWEATVNKCEVENASKNSNFEKEQKIISENTLIYPNPVASSLHIIIPSSEETLGDSFISITDVLGKVVGNYIYKESNTSLDLDLSNLSSGSYFIKITNKREVITKKIMKQ